MILRRKNECVRKDLCSALKLLNRTAHTDTVSFLNQVIVILHRAVDLDSRRGVNDGKTQARGVGIEPVHHSSQLTRDQQAVQHSTAIDPANIGDGVMWKAQITRGNLNGDFFHRNLSFSRQNSEGQGEGLDAFGLKVIHNAHGKGLRRQPTLREGERQRKERTKIRNWLRRTASQHVNLDHHLVQGKVNRQLNGDEVAFKGHDVRHGETHCWNGCGVQSTWQGIVLSEKIKGVFRIVHPLLRNHIPIGGTNGHIWVSNQRVVKHGHVVHGPAIARVLPHNTQGVDHHAIALKGGGVISIEQRHVIQHVCQLRQRRFRPRVGNHVNLTGTERTRQFEFVVGHGAAVVVRFDSVLRKVRGTGCTGVVDLQTLAKGAPVNILREKQV